MPPPAAREGFLAVLPLLVGVVPFGLVFGVTAAEAGFALGEVVGSSVIVFAGASQLAMVDLLADGASPLVAAAAVWTINARMLLYGASLAPRLAPLPLRTRVLGSYLLTDQAYAVTIARDPQEPAAATFRFYLAAGAALWATWQVSTVAGAVTKGGVPEGIPLDFAVPLMFLALLVPTLTARPAVVAAVVGGGMALVVIEAGAGDVAILLGVVAGVLAGSLAGRPDPSGAAADGPRSERQDGR